MTTEDFFHFQWLVLILKGKMGKKMIMMPVLYNKA